MLIYSVVALATLIAVASFAVDYGRAMLVKTELQGAADAAARAGAAIADDTAVSQAVATAALNYADGKAVVLDSNADVELGHWDVTTSTFTVDASSVDAVRVTARRTVARNTPVTLTLARVFGQSTLDVTTQAIAACVPSGYAIVGLDSISMSGNASAAYWSTNGKSANKYGSIASNGDITLGGSTSISGDARPGIGGTVYGVSHVTGSTKPLNKTLTYADADAGSAATINNNSSLPGYSYGGGNFTLGGNQSVTLTTGSYFFQNFSAGSNTTITCSGAVTIYCCGTFSLNGTVITASSVPSNLNLVMCPDTGGNPPGAMSLGSSSNLYAKVYAPQSALTMSGSGDIWGSIVAKSINMTGSSGIHYDLVLDPTAGQVRLVN